MAPVNDENIIIKEGQLRKWSLWRLITVVNALFRMENTHFFDHRIDPSHALQKPHIIISLEAWRYFFMFQDKVEDELSRKLKH